MWPKYREFTISAFWTNVDGDAAILKYLPDKESTDRPISREYAYTILGTIRRSYSKAVIENAINKRHNIIKTKLAPTQVTINQALLNALTSFPMKPVSQGQSIFNVHLRAKGDGRFVL